MKAHIPAFAQPAFLEFVSAHAAKGDPDAQRCMDKLPTKGVRKRLDLPGKSKAERATEHRASTGDLRADLWERCGGKDEVTGEPLGTSWEMHHVQNAGERRAKQRAGNVLALSWETHRAAHRGDLRVLCLIAAAPTLDAEAKRAAERRIAKVREARRLGDFDAQKVMGVRPATSSLSGAAANEGKEGGR